MLWIFIFGAIITSSCGTGELEVQVVSTLTDPFDGPASMFEVTKEIEIRMPTPTDIPTVVPSATITATPEFIVVWVNDHEMVLVPEGEFKMGSDISESNESPAHIVYTDSFLIGKYEVTNQQFANFLNEMGNRKEGRFFWLDERSVDARIFQIEGIWVANTGYENHPAVEVSWFGARAYCNWAGGRLPTEAEWEKAARGTDGRTYPWGEELNASMANYGRNINDTSPIGTYPLGMSPFGAMDMAGNAWEWVSDWYASEYYSISPLENPSGPLFGEKHVLRGGAWYYIDNVSTTNRDYHPGSANNFGGFRCVISIRQ